MRNICKLIITALALLHSIHTEAHKYTLQMTNWSYSNRQVTNVTYNFNGGSFSISRGSPFTTFYSAIRITEFTVHITGFYSLDPNGSGPAYDFKGTYIWASDKLSMEYGDAGVYPKCNWDPGITLEARDAATGTLLPNNSIIDCDKKVQINILDKHGYTGDVPLYLGNNASFTDVNHPLGSMGGTSTNFIPDNNWNKFLDLFGSVSGALTQGFYIKPIFTYPNNAYSASTGIGPFNLKDYVAVSPYNDGSEGICGELGIKPRHMVKPFTVEIVQNSKTYSALCTNDSLVMDQNILATKGFVTNMSSYITIRNTGGNITTRTKLVRFLQPAPDTTNVQFIYNNQSCEENSDGSLTITLPEKDYSYNLRFSYRDLQSVPVVLTTSSNTMLIPLDPGSYNILVDYDIGPSEPGCTTSLGTHVIESAPELRITSINATKMPTCSYTEDAELTIIAEGGVPGARSYIRLTDMKPYSSNVIRALKGGTAYSFKVIDSKECESEAFIGTTSAKIQLLAAVTGNGNINCFGDLQTESLSASGGNSGYLFSVNGENVNSGPYAFKGNLHVTNYEIVASDNKGCRDTILVSFPEPLQLKFMDPAYALSQFNGFNLKCNNDLSGVIKLNKTGGTGVTRFKLTGPNTVFGPQTDSLFQNLNAGSFSASMTDAKGCISQLNEQIILTQPAGIEFSEPNINHETCSGTGDAEIETVLSGTASSFQWYRSEVVMTGKNTRNLTDATPGSYKLEVKYNADACSTMSSLYVIPSTPQLNFSVLTHQSCTDGIGGGYIELTGINHGTGPFSYMFNGGTVRNITSFPVIFENLNQDEYSLEIRDANYNRGGIYSEQCKTSGNFQISSKSSAQLSYNVTNPLCFDDSNGKIVASVSGPDNPFIHAWFNTIADSIGTGNLLENIPDGKYTMLIKDDYHCQIQAGVIDVVEPKKLAFTTIIPEDAACNDINDGRITVQEPAGGTKNYQYSSNAGFTWQANPVFTGLHSGTYQLKIRDAHGCNVDSIMQIGIFHPFLTSLGNDSVSCSGFSDGRLTLDAGGSKADGSGYIYILKNSLGGTLTNSTGIFQNLKSGPYNIYAKDTKNCFTDTLFQQIGEPGSFDIQLALIDSASCSQYTGMISYTISGGNGGNRLLWYNSKLGESAFLNVAALQSGTYKLTVEDRKGCSKSASITVPDRPAPVITNIELLKRAWCDLPLASAKVNVTGGSPKYSYLWDNHDADQGSIADNLAEGTYHVTVTDRFNCTDIDEIKIIDGPPVVLSSNIQHPHCGQKDGLAELIVSGGVQPFLFIWPDSVAENPVSEPVMSNLFSGIYPVVVIDSVGCSGSFTVSLSDLNGPDVHSIDISKSWCGLSHGTAEAFASGGTLPYRFEWMPSGSTNIIGTNPKINNLHSGKYMIRITDQENCRVLREIQVSDSIELQPVLSLISMDSASCNRPLGSLWVSMNKGLQPYTFKWNTGAVTNPIQNISKGIYHVTASDQRGCKDSLELYLPDRKLPVITLLSKESAYCGQSNGIAGIAGALGRPPYKAYLTSDLSNKIPLVFNSSMNRYAGFIGGLFPLTSPYQVKLEDADGCESPEIGVMINDNSPMTVQLVDILPVSCNGLSDGHAEIKADNGFEPYTYTWEMNSVDSVINTNLPAGPFRVTVTDARNCAKTLYVTETPIIQPEPVSLSDLHLSDPSCNGVCDGTATPVAAGGNGGYLFVWNNIDTANNGTGLCPGKNKLEIIDAKGCRYENSVVIINPPALSQTNLPEFATMCSGQHFLANPGNEWSNVSWTGDNGFTSIAQIADIVTQGVYYMRGYSAEGCLVLDTLKVETSDNLLDAQFLMMSQAYAGDTVVIIEVSWPVAENYTWDLPEGASLIKDKEYYKELVFEEAGNYYIQVTATLAGCSSIKGKYIEIFDVSGKPMEEESHEVPPVIKSFTAYPNPAISDFNLDVILTEETDIRVEIIAVGAGNLNKVINDYGRDHYLLNVSTDELMRGTYIVRLIAENEMKTKILIVR